MSKINLKKEIFPVTGMTCASCAANIETQLNQASFVQSAKVNFASGQVIVEYDSNHEASELNNSLSFTPFDIVIDTEDPFLIQEKIQAEEFKVLTKKLKASTILGIPVFILGMFFGELAIGAWVSMFLSIPVLFIYGIDFHRNAFMLLKNKMTNMDTLVSMSTLTAFVFSVFSTVYPQYWIERGLKAHVYFEAAVVIICFIMLGKWLEKKAKTKTSQALKNIMSYQVNIVHQWVDNKEQEVNIKFILPDDVIVIKAGERIAVDGEVIWGESSIDESMMTGEFIAQEKSTGDKVYAGTLNQLGTLRIKVQQVGKDTRLSQMITRIQEAQGSKAKIQNLVDEISKYFVPTVLFIAIGTFVFWFNYSSENNLAQAILNAVSVMVIACPCALGLATPTALMVGVGRGAQNHILIKEASALEVAPKVDTIVFDKTGTLTQGKTTIKDLYWLKEKGSKEQFEILCSLESQSNHPMAEAFKEYQLKNKIQTTSVFEFKNFLGKGIQAKDKDGLKYSIGNESLLKELEIEIPNWIEQRIVKYKSSGLSLLYFVCESEILSLIQISDPLKESSKEAIRSLIDEGYEVHLLSGDQEEVVKGVANNVGIKNFKGEALPEDKSAYINQLKQEGKIVAMVGDGINDSEAFTQSHLSMAMAKGADVAIEVADMTLMKSSLKSVLEAIHLSKQTLNSIKQNLFWAFIYNLIGIPIAAGALYFVGGFFLNPMIASGAMALSSISVVLNSLRWKRAAL
jgi:Cu2+-exporting ATPase